MILWTTYENVIRNQAGLSQGVKYVGYDNNK